MNDFVRGAIFFFLLLSSSFFGSLFFLIPTLPLALIAPRLWRLLTDRIIAMWFIFCVSVYKCTFDTKFRVTGDSIEFGRPGLILMNHRTRLDWLYFWSAVYIMDPWLLVTHKISLKSSLKRLPGAGWAMSLASFIFLSRQLDQDLKFMEILTNYYMGIKEKYQILFFPEGTDLNPYQIERSNLYAEKHGLPKYDHVLHPRSAGFTHFVKMMRSGGYIDYVYDITVAYPYGVGQTETDLVLRGKAPKAAHFLIKRYDVRELPYGDEELSDWLNALWMQKECELKSFYTEANETCHFDSNEHRSIVSMGHFDTVQYFAVLVWTLFGFVCLYLITCRIIQYYILVACVFCVCLQIFYNGAEFFVIDLLQHYHKYNNPGRSL